jgi:phage/plasmid replication protein, gene II/X family
MIDWFSGLVGYDAERLEFGRVLVVDRQGNVEFSHERWEKAVGSYTSSIQVNRDSATEGMRLEAKRNGLLSVPDTVLKVSGNPVKYLQGHNVAGVDAKALVLVLRDMCRQLSGPLEVPFAVSIELPAVHASRVDIAVMVDMGSHTNVHTWLRTAELSTRSRHGRPLVSGDTVYWGKNSRRWSLKAYCKRCELEAHPVADLVMNRRLQEYVESQLRIELTLRRPELKDKSLEELDESLVWEYFGRLTIGVENVKKERTTEITTRGLTLGQRLVLVQWFEGTDVRQLMPKRTFYHYRRKILEVVGVDISLPCTLEQEEAERINFSLEYMAKHTVRAVPRWLAELCHWPLVER